MILYFVLVGFVTGILGAATVFNAGGGFLLAALAYSLAGGLGVVISAIFAAVTPSFPRPGSGLGVGARRLAVDARRVPVPVTRR